jgi:tRNA threonylcarbamoyladenosine biosynthesis protein TsaB
MERDHETLLVMETSGLSLGVALVRGGALVFARDVQAGAVHGKALIPLVEEALAGAGLGVKELAAVAVSTGPGSWTGLRIGLSAAKTFAWAAGIPLVPVPSFEGLCSAAREQAPGAAVLCLRDARSEGHFAALFSPWDRGSAGGNAETFAPFGRWIEECVLKTPLLLERVAQALPAGVPLAVCGDPACTAALGSALKERGAQVLEGLQHVPVAALAPAAWARWVRGAALRETEEIHRAGPLYLRASDPEIKFGVTRADSPPVSASGR